MCRFASIVGLLLTLSATGAWAQSSRIPVTVTNAAEERTARGLSSAVINQLRSDPRFALADGPAPGALNIALPAQIGWERRLDWTEISYQVRLNGADSRSQVIAGHCWNWNLAVCAKQIADAASGFAR
jgi:hypothetical protein